MLPTVPGVRQWAGVAAAESRYHMRPGAALWGRGAASLKPHEDGVPMDGTCSQGPAAPPAGVFPVCTRESFLVGSGGPWDAGDWTQGSACGKGSTHATKCGWHKCLGQVPWPAPTHWHGGGGGITGAMSKCLPEDSPCPRRRGQWHADISTPGVLATARVPHGKGGPQNRNSCHLAERPTQPVASVNVTKLESHR